MNGDRAMADALIQLFSETLGVPADKLNDDSSPETVSKWDSLAAMQIVVAIEEKYNISLSTKDIMKMSTIGRARQLLLDKNVAL
jgi:acyl carrier protein